MMFERGETFCRYKNVQYVLKPLVLSNFITRDHRIAFNCDWLAHEAYRFVEGVINEGELDHQRFKRCLHCTNTYKVEKYATYPVVGPNCHEGLLMADIEGV